MKKLIPILVIPLLITTACVTTDQNPESLSTSYDGVWDGYTDTPEGRFYINMQIINGIMTGYVEESKISGRIDGNDNLVINPFSVAGAQVRLDVGSMSKNLIEGTVMAIESRPKWFVKKKIAVSISQLVYSCNTIYKS